MAKLPITLLRSCIGLRAKLIARRVNWASLVAKFVKELPAMLSNFSFSCETYLVGSCETKCWANLVSLDLLGPSHELFLAYCLLHWISRVQVTDSSPLRWVKNWSSACPPLVFIDVNKFRHYLGQLRILSFLECQQVRFKVFASLQWNGTDSEILWTASVDGTNVAIVVEFSFAFNSASGLEWVRRGIV